jgi:PhnB protein
MKLNPYLHYNGDCAEAFAFYERALGGKITMMSRYGEAPADSRPPGSDDLVMHAEFNVDGAVLYGSDAPPEWAQAMGGFSVALQFSDVDKARAAYDALVEGGKPVMPMAETFWAHSFGMLVDRFGVPWMLNCPKGM